jgi:3-oxoacyl-[acyl-carrier-protein] synthase-1
MTAAPIAIHRTGLVTSVGLTAAQSCAAFRAKLTNPTETRFIDSGGEWIMAHQVALEQPWRGLMKLAKMAAMAIEEALHDLPRAEWDSLPLLLCVAEADRPGRTAGLDDQLLELVQRELGVNFAPLSAVVPHGRVAVAVAMAVARSMLAQGPARRVLVAATDSLLSWPQLSHYESSDRLLTARNSNGFMPGEAAGALLLGQPTGGVDELVCTGVGFADEAAHLDSGEPLRADGLSQAIKLGLQEAGWQMHDLDYRITDISGEQYYFKEAALALSRILRVRKEEFDLWHPAECAGETGAAAGMLVLATAQTAGRKGYSPGRHILAHMATDAGRRTALVLKQGGTA